jgi:hypothetical protein
MLSNEGKKGFYKKFLTEVPQVPVQRNQKKVPKKPELFINKERGGEAF